MGRAQGGEAQARAQAARADAAAAAGEAEALAVAQTAAHAGAAAAKAAGLQAADEPESHGEVVRAWAAAHKRSPPSHGELVRDWVERQAPAALVAGGSAAAWAAAAAAAAAAAHGRGNSDTPVEEIGGGNALGPESAEAPLSLPRAAVTLVALAAFAAALARGSGRLGDGRRGGVGRRGRFPGPAFAPPLGGRFRPVLDALAAARRRSPAAASERFLPDFLPDLWPASAAQAVGPRGRGSSPSGVGVPGGARRPSFVVQGFGPTGGGVGRPAP
jgi:hypothetical protein